MAIPGLTEVWDGLGSQPWWMRALIGACVGAFIFVVVPLLTQPKGGRGGDGGSVKVIGGGTGIGGRGGGSGPGGRGGDGGSVEIRDGGFGLGGEGGEAGQLDRRARGGRSPFEVMGIPDRVLPDGSRLYDAGKGGDGGGPPRKD